MVKIIPVNLVDSENILACETPFCPVVASNTNKLSCGASGYLLVITLLIFASSFIKLTLFCNLPAVSIIKTSYFSFSAFSNAL
ncbi:Uncharacterised protein [Chlamydia abortus]|nr:Uncharacterised protein [Chlamydia abortus]